MRASLRGEKTSSFEKLPGSELDALGEQLSLMLYCSGLQVPFQGASLPLYPRGRARHPWVPGPRPSTSCSLSGAQPPRGLFPWSPLPPLRSQSSPYLALRGLCSSRVFLLLSNPAGGKKTTKPNKNPNPSLRLGDGAC